MVEVSLTIAESFPESEEREEWLVNYHKTIFSIHDQNDYLKAQGPEITQDYFEQFCNFNRKIFVKLLKAPQASRESLMLNLGVAKSLLQPGPFGIRIAGMKELQ